MKIILRTLFIIIFSNYYLIANENTEQHIKQPLKIVMPLLKQIEKYSINYGNGKKIIYAFVDPMCPHSKNFIEMISNNEKSKRIYTYKIFLLRLEKFDSQLKINYLYSLKENSSELLNIMLKNKQITDKMVENKENYDKIIKEISYVSKKLDIYKRPYLFVVKHPKEFK